MKLLNCPSCGVDLRDTAHGPIDYTQAIQDAQDELKTLLKQPTTKLRKKWADGIRSDIEHMSGPDDYYMRSWGMYDLDEDRVVTWHCPDCEHSWEPT